MNKITCVLLAIILFSSFAMKRRTQIESTTTGDLTQKQTECLETCATQLASTTRIQTEWIHLPFLVSLATKLKSNIRKIQLDAEDGGNDEGLDEEEVLVAFYCSGKCGIEF